MGKSKKDSLGDRMKNSYENRTRHYLPRRTYTIIRLDGKAFHTFTRGLKKPFDVGFVVDMTHTAQHLVNNIQGAQFAYVQSDEISILLTDFNTITTDAWFDGNIQKICSVSASLATAKFNNLRIQRCENYPVEEIDFIKQKLAYFDSRVFTIPDPIEVENYFIWRQKDWYRNSVNMVGQSHYSHKELHGKKINEVLDMIHLKGDNWNNYDDVLKNGTVVTKDDFTGKIIFTKDRESLRGNLIPTFTTGDSDE